VEALPAALCGSNSENGCDCGCGALRMDVNVAAPEGDGGARSRRLREGCAARVACWDSLGGEQRNTA